MNKLKYELNPKGENIAIKGGKYLVAIKSAHVSIRYYSSDSCYNISPRPTLKATK